MRRLCLLALFALTACGGSDLVLPNEGQPASLAVVRGDLQNGTVGQPLPDSLVVRVTDRFGDPVPGAEVTWTADNGGTVDPATSLTDGAGRAATVRTLGSQAGTYTTRASVTGLEVDPAIFVTNALAAQLILATQPGSIATSGTPLDPQPVLQLADPAGNPIARGGVTVTVQIASGSGSLSGGTSATSDDNGRVAFAGLAVQGSAGLRTLIFAADGFASVISAPIALGVGAPASIELVTGDGQTVTVGSPLPIAPSVLVKDATGNGVAGVPVSWTARITEQQPERLIAWRSDPDGAVELTATFRFTPAGAGTRVDARVVYAAPAGGREKAAAALIGDDPSTRLGAELERAKAMIELGGGD